MTRAAAVLREAADVDDLPARMRRVAFSGWVEMVAEADVLAVIREALAKAGAASVTVTAKEER